MGPQLYRCGNYLPPHHRVFVLRDASMGPQLYRCGNTAAPRPDKAPSTRFNGAATLSLRKFLVGDNSLLFFYRLQWGRNFIVAEIVRVRIDTVSELEASMGPQLYRCGNWPLIDVTATVLHTLQWGRNFIVAEMSVEAKYRSDDIKLQWGRNFIVAEIRNYLICLYYPFSVLQWGRNFIVAEIGQSVRPITCRESCFNGAATLSLRKYADVLDGLRLHLIASMGPQLYRCGNGGRRPHPLRRHLASMGPQLYRCGNLPLLVGQPRRIHASMGPQLYRCGNVRNFHMVHHTCIRFNGAATLSLWKFDKTKARVLELEKASMGPQLYRCGNGFWVRSLCAKSRRLQWGRNFIVAEMPAPPPSPPLRVPCFNGAATLSLRKSTRTRSTTW